MASQMTQPSLAEQSAILSCLRRIRRRLYAVRLIERVAVALVWGAVMAMCLTAERLLHQPYPLLSLAVGLLPLAWAAWLFAGAGELAGGGATARLSRAAGILLVCTAALWAVGVAVYLKESGQLQVPMRRLFLAVGFVPAGAAVWVWFSGRQLLRDSSLSRGLLQRAAGLTAVLALAAMGLLVLSGFQAPLWMVPGAVLLIFAAFAAATVRPVGAQSAAIFVDQQAGLQERVSTALELFESPVGSELEAAFRAPVIASAIHACQSVRSAKVNYARIDSRVYALAGAVAIAAGGVSLLSPLAARANAVRLPNQVLVRQGDALTKKLQEIEATKKIDDPAVKAELAKLSRVAESMRKGDMSAFDANTKLSEIAQSLQDQNQQSSMADVEKAMEASKATDPLAQASEEMKSAALSAGSNAPGTQHSRENAATKVQDAAKDLANKLGGMSEQEKKDLANQLNQAADKAKDPQLKKDLEDAAKAAQQGDSKQLQQNMADAGNRMGEQGAKQQLSQEAIKQAMDQINQAQGGDSGQQNQSQSDGGQQNGGSPQANGGGQNQGGQGNQQQNQSGGQGGQQNQGNQGSQGGNQQGSQGQSRGGAAANGQSPGGNPLDDPRNGSTNFNQPGAPGDHSAGHPLGGTETFVRIYDEKPIDSRGKIENTPGHINPLGSSSGSIDTYAAGDKSSPTIKSYESELPAARKRALDDLSTQQIPPEDKDLIRSFYSDDSH